MSLGCRLTLLATALLVGVIGIHSLAMAAPLEAQTIKIGGAGGALGAMRVLAAAFKKSHSDANIVIVPGLGSSGGRRALLQGAIDIAVTSKAVGDVENIDGVVARLLGRTPFVFATSNNNQTNALTTQELVDIWGGKTTTWPDGSRLRLILRPATDSDTDVLKRISPAMEQAVKSALLREGMKIAATDGETADAIETIAGALGTSTLTLIISEKRPLKVLALNGVAPSPKAIADGSYPHFKSIYALTMSKPTGLAEKFIGFLRSSSGREILAQSGHAPGETGP